MEIESPVSSTRTYIPEALDVIQTAITQRALAIPQMIVDSTLNYPLQNSFRLVG